ncbi:MAG: SMC-Scp complex subunit ScpB [Clostridiales bacterium]|nr:SMC-Scp complex subunit ScpB [Clostridiales bacterium]
MNLNNYINIIEALLVASEEPVSVKKISQLLEINEQDAKKLLSQLDEYYNTNQRGIQLYFFKDKVQLGTNPEYMDYIKKMIKTSKNKGLTDAAMEVLSIIAYKQPITKSEIEYIRGINSDRLINQLMERYLVEEKGRLEKIGRPKIYGTSDIFLRNFNLKSLKELPNINYEQIEE